MTLAPSASLTRKMMAAADALQLAQVALAGTATERVLLLAMRRRAELSAEAAALVQMIESEGAVDDPAP